MRELPRDNSVDQAGRTQQELGGDVEKVEELRDIMTHGEPWLTS